MYCINLRMLGFQMSRWSPGIESRVSRGYEKPSLLVDCSATDDDDNNNLKRI
jgi:hypothetical protein